MRAHLARIACIAIVLSVASCGKKSAPPPPSGDAALPPATFGPLALLPPLRASSTPIANGRWEATLTRSIAVMHTREHIAHYGATMHATLVLGDEQATVCIDGSATSSSDRRDYNVRLPDGGREDHRDQHTNGKAPFRASLRGSVRRSGLDVRLALAPDPTACGDAGPTSAIPSALSCMPVTRDRDGGTQDELVACRWDEDAPYTGAGFELTADDGKQDPHTQPRAARTWLLLGSTLDARVDEAWNSPRRLTLR